MESSSDGSKKNKFREREATDDTLPLPTLDEDALLNTKCPQNVELRWQAEVSSSIYATPLIADINSDGKSEIVVPSFVHYLEVLEGSDGDKMPGWPAFHKSTVHASPLLYDIDKDGIREVALATYNGEVIFFRVSGYLMSDKLEVPRLKVHKDWYVGLGKDHSDRAHPDVHDDVLIQEAIDNKAISQHQGDVKETKSNESVLSNGVLEHQASSNASKSESLSHVSQNASLHSALEHNDQTGAKIELPKHTTTELHDETKANVTKEDHVGSDEASMHDILNMGVAANATDTVKSMGSGSQRRLLTESETESSKEGDSGGAATVVNDQDLAEEADSSFDLFRDGEDGLTDEYSYDYDDYVDEAAWGDEDFAEAQHPKPEDFVNIDSHILCTPVIADIDKDGVNEMIVAASYFFDHEASGRR